MITTIIGLILISLPLSAMALSQITGSKDDSIRAILILWLLLWVLCSALGVGGYLLFFA